MKFIAKTYTNRNLVNKDDRLVSSFAILLLVIAVFHHFILCFINTTFFSVPGFSLVLIEILLVGITFGFFLFNATLSYILIILFIIANSFLLSLFSGWFDPKDIRNFLVPILMIWLGTRYDQRISIDKLLFYLCILILMIGLFELFLPSIFQSYFNVLDFLVSTGRLKEIPEYAETAFALNGTRYGGRNILSFLGNHRVASIFLETVTVSNFASVVAAWGLSKSNFGSGRSFYLLGLTIAILADSRFGLTTILLLTTLRFFASRELLRYVSYFIPLIVLIMCFYIGKDYTHFRDDFETRLGSTGFYIMNFHPLEFFGLSSNHYSKFLDQGYAKLFHYQGLVLGIVMWVSFCLLNLNREGELFKFFVAIIIATNLAISGDSIFSFKWVAIMWFLLGTKMAQPMVNNKYKSGEKYV